eukprot:TRINITY_DN9419_c0_g1_i1.p1 TRINITY_DN9419_c0_g1~~TRINITY_DN9419_c0_g1_i1.p1  ORF type:complete len:198 (-),score=51.51 TRINITY_DN9419_c0_g1_i1:169-717(-)
MTFSSPTYLKFKTGKYGTERPQYLQALVSEFQDTEDQDAKEQILANLANFAYDPLNYADLRKLNVIELFLDMLTEPSERLVEFGAGGLSNCCCEIENAKIIVANEGVENLIQILKSAHEETVLSSLSTLFFLCSCSDPTVSSSTKNGLKVPTAQEIVKSYSGSKNGRLKNLSSLLLEKMQEK